MVKHFFHLFQKKFGRRTEGLHEAAYFLAIFTFLSQILGLVRDRLLAHIFGASAALDVYYAAFRIPDFLFVSLASLAGAYALIPFLEEKKREGREAARDFLGGIATAVFAVMAVVSFVLYLTIPFLSAFVAPGFSGAEKEEFIFLSRLFLFSPFFIGFSNLLGSVTQAGRRFFVFALSPILYNFGIILGIIFLAPSWGVRGVAFGVIFGAVLHLLVQIPAVHAEGLVPRFFFRLSRTQKKDMRRVLCVSLPRTIALSASHFSFLLLAALATLISPGSVSIFQFSFNLQSVPLGIIGVSYSVAAFPTLARLWSEKNTGNFADHIAAAARHIIFWSLPVIVLFIVLRAQIVRVTLGSGAFNWDHTRLTAAALAIFTVSLLAQNLVLLLARGYYAAGKTKRVLGAALFSAASAIALGAMFFRLFSSSEMFRNFLEHLLKIEGIAGSIVVVLPLAWSLGNILNAGLLWFFFRRDFFSEKSAEKRTSNKRLGEEVSHSLRDALLASLFLGIFAYAGLNILAKVFNINTFLGIFFQGACAGIFGILVWAAILHAMKNREFTDALAAGRKKFWKTKPVAPEQEGL